jgi:NAD(P)-dependent dehydrogenase (short-subunit alcohol dehydrogenase family)
MPKTWFITGASRGLGAEIVRAAVRAGHQVIAGARNPKAVTDNLGRNSDQVLAVELDVTDASATRAAVDAALSRFGAIDVLVNNAGYGHYGFFEESTIDDAKDQFATNLFGVLYVTWAILPTMRAARKGRIFNLSSLGGLIGAQLASLYCATKFALEGFSESLAKEVAPFGIHVTIIEPGPFRTDFLTPRSIRFGQKRIADYDDRRAALLAGVEERNGRQPGDPARLAEAIVSLAETDTPPLRFLAGSVAVSAAEAKLAGMREEFDRWRQLSVSTDGNYSDSAGIGSMMAQMDPTDREGGSAARAPS